MRSNVRFLLLLAVVSMLATAASSCSNSGPAGVYADILWRVRCEAMAGCSGYMDRSILGFDREMGQRVACSVIETEANRTLTFSASAGGVGVAMSGASFARAGGSPAGAGCVVTVTDDNTFTGQCGSSPPSEAQPCQVNAVTFGTDDEGRSLITGQVLCAGISPSAAPSINREVTAPGNDPGASTMPFTFNLYDCNGFNPD